MNDLVEHWLVVVVVVIVVVERRLDAMRTAVITEVKDLGAAFRLLLCGVVIAGSRG
jgi:hypothetical protein